MNAPLDALVAREGLEIFAALKKESGSLFDPKIWLGRLMELVLKDPQFKVDLFRFVDVLPSLKTKEQLADHVKQYLLIPGRDIPLLFEAALKASSLSLMQGFAFSAIQKNVTQMARQFIAGANLPDAKKNLEVLIKEGFSFTIDLLGEMTLSEQEAEEYEREVSKLIALLAQLATPTLLPNISIKISSLASFLNEADPKDSVARLKTRVWPLLKQAKAAGVFVNFDMESHAYKEITLELFREVITSEEFLAWPHLGIVIQTYLKSAPDDVAALLSWCKKRQAPITVRLVKGAYWDYEVVVAEKSGHDVPVLTNKAVTDQQYEELSQVLLKHINLVTPAFASHNMRSLAHAIAFAQSLGIKKDAYEIQMLYGMHLPEGRVFCSRGHRVRIYVPVGEMIPGMAYLVRRLLENTSQMGFVKMSHHDRKDASELLTKPDKSHYPTFVQAEPRFRNAAFTDFTVAKNRNLMLEALSQVQKSLPVRIPLVIGGERIFTGVQKTIMCPSEIAVAVAQVSLASRENAQASIAKSVAAARELKNQPLTARASCLENLAKVIERDRHFLAAVMAFEVGKPWKEADGEVAEAIDFCRYYAEGARVELAWFNLGPAGGEDNFMGYTPRGVSVIIAPWNFPLAILTGMSVAAYVAGNPIVMKPAEQSSLTALCLYERMLEAGFNKAAVQFLPGAGEEVGPFLVAHPQVATIGFTGSMAVGHEILKVASNTQPDQVQMKKLVLEMGGKNCVIIDDDADIDEAILGLLASAFGYAGQKCSAASRAIVLAPIKDQLVLRLVAAAKSLKVKKSQDPAADVGPVINEEAYARLNRQIDRLKNDPDITMLYACENLGGGYFIGPHIVATKDPHHWVMQEELFGPILAVYVARDIDEAITVANGTRFGLVAGFFSRNPRNIEKVKRELSVGNLYINQKCTGAMVARQPFGGFKMSGTGLKAGGPHYLLNFVDAVCTSENTMRRGFSPGVSS
jgi:RHH-type proline utilization regulon transcriptional repressor/proline dehydrogenase/delta 1-pyrroline-5-carboxylate dehydrogenase